MILGKWYKIQGTNIAYPYKYFHSPHDAVWVIYQNLRKDKWGNTAVTSDSTATETARPDDLYPFFETIFK